MKTPTGSPSNRQSRFPGSRSEAGGILGQAGSRNTVDDVSLTRGANPVGPAGFEQQTSSGVTSPWHEDGNAGASHGIGCAHPRAGLSGVPP